MSNPALKDLIKAGNDFLRKSLIEAARFDPNVNVSGEEIYQSIMVMDDQAMDDVVKINPAAKETMDFAKALRAAGESL
ncbi:hypothetical protein [Thalassospira sp. UBA1131]|uniref:hypothetical protein n=1 Tax=Thalassospira sp. UBA1131 TaxID=1947672 RepID=UPI0025EBB670|nr:hypothetical protein [Thalassospira sp. UBA1131]